MIGRTPPHRREIRTHRLLRSARIPLRLAAASLGASIFLGCLAALAPPAGAHEPDGRIRFHAEGVAKPSEPVPGIGPSEKLLRLSIEGVVPLAGAILIHSCPPGVAQRLVTIRRGKESRSIDPGAGAPQARVELGPLDPGAPLVLDFAEEVPTGAGGIVVFRIQMPRPDGTVLWEESFGLFVGEAPNPGALRNGAIEYPAHELPEGAR